MRVVTQLRTIAAATTVAVVALAAVLYGSLGEFRAAELEHDLVEGISARALERASLGDRYLHYREPQLRQQWEANKRESDALIVKAQDRFQQAEDLQRVEGLRAHVERSADIFRRIAANSDRVQAAAASSSVWLALERRLASQLLLRDAAVHDAASRLQEASELRLANAYRHLLEALGLFASVVAFATVGSAVYLSTLIRKRLVPLHAAAQTVADGDLSQRIGLDQRDEFGELAAALNAMTDRLQDHARELEAEIAERKRAEAAALAAKAEAERANQAKSRFLAAASHDLRQPLAALSLYVGLLKNRVSADGGKVVANVEDCVASLSELLSSLLDVSKLDAGVVTPRPVDFAVDEVLTSLIALHASEAQMKGLQLHARPSGVVVRTDKQLFMRIVGNFVANAVSYTERGSVLIACRRHQGKHWVEVWDTGVGIAEDEIGVVFEEFRQLGDDARNRGSGLGLAIAAKTAVLLGLRIRLRSRLGRGSMFAIELPAAAATSAEQAPPGETTLATRTLRIGLAEDNAMVQGALILALRGAGHQVVAAADGSALLAALAGRSPDLLICDFRLAAGESGFDVIAAARAEFGAELPAILITGDTDPGLVRSMADRGIAVHFKPMQIEALLATVASASERRQDVAAGGLRRLAVASLDY